MLHSIKSLGLEENIKFKSNHFIESYPKYKHVHYKLGIYPGMQEKGYNEIKSDFRKFQVADFLSLESYI